MKKYYFLLLLFTYTINSFSQCFENREVISNVKYYNSINNITLTSVDSSLVTSISSVLFTNPVVMYYNNSKNAVFRLKKRLEKKECKNCPTKLRYSNDGFVFLGKEFLIHASKQKTSAKTKGLGLFNKIFIISHEIAHSFQYKNFLRIKNIDLYKVYGKENNKTIELGADFLSGIYIGFFVKTASTQKGFENPIKEAINEVGYFIFSSGDFQFLNKKHHGTGAERFSAFYEGYKLGLTKKINESNLLIWSIEFMNKINTNKYPQSNFKN